MAQKIDKPCYKAPGDTLKQSVDFTPDLPDGVTLSSAAASVTKGAGILTVGATPTNDTSVATLTITGGRKGQTYEIEVAGTYSDGQVRTFTIEVIVV